LSPLFFGSLSESRRCCGKQATVRPCASSLGHWYIVDRMCKEEEKQMSPGRSFSSHERFFKPRSARRATDLDRYPDDVRNRVDCLDRRRSGQQSYSVTPCPNCFM